MSSSVFVETPRIAGEPLLNGGAGEVKADSNLVVVYGKNGINVDRKGLENLIDEKTLTSISVIRITSPTPSMEEEEAEEIRKEDEKNAEESEKSHDSEENDDEDDKTDSDDGRKSPKPAKMPTRVRPEIVGLTVEEFYPPDAAKELAKEILKMAGVTPLKCDVDYEFQRYVIKNDHCYTPYTSPSQLNKKKQTADEEDKSQALSVRKTPGTAATVKQYLNKRKLLLDESKRKHSEKEKSTVSASEQDEATLDEEHTEEDHEDDADGDLDDEETDLSEESEASAESDNDRDSDLDFDVNNRHGRKRKTTISRRKKKEKQRARSVMMQKAANSKRRVQSQDNNIAHEDEKATVTPVKVNKQPNDMRKSLSGFNPIIGAARKQMPESVESPAEIKPCLSPQPLPKVKQLINIQSVQVIQPAVTIPPKPTEIIATHSNLFQPKAIQPPVIASQSPQPVKQIINKVIASPKGGFTDLSTLLARPDKHQMNVRVTEIKPDKVSPPPPAKGFMPLGIDAAAKNQLPAQISIQTHQSSSEIAAENDKLDLIDSIVKDDLEKPFKPSEKPPMKENSIPDLVKMLESTEKAVMEKNKLSTSFASSSVEVIDIANAPLLETPDDEIPDDLLQHVVELMEDKSLQEAVEKDLLQQQQQKQQLQQEPQVKQIQLPQHQSQVNILPQTLRHPLVVTTPLIKQPKSIIEASISNTTTPSSSRDTTPTPTPNRIHSATYLRKEPIQIVRGNGRVITLPPIEAPTTRAKRRAQAHPTADSSFHDSESCDVSMHSDTSVCAEPSISEKSDPLLSSLQKEHVTAPKAKKKGKKKGKQAAAVVKSGEEESQEDEDEDDPNKLWCICRQPHNNRFMICCDVCEDWFHGTCVSITKAMGLEMEQKGVEWTCPKCVKKLESKKQRKITDLFDKKTLVQPMPRLDELPKTFVQPVIRLNQLSTEVPVEKQPTIELKKPTVLTSLSKVDVKRPMPRVESVSPVVLPTTLSLTSPEPVQKKLTDFSLKKTPDVTSAGNVAKRILVLPTGQKTTVKALTLVKSGAGHQQQLKFSKVPTAAEKKQFTITKVQNQHHHQYHSKNVPQIASIDSELTTSNSSNIHQRSPMEKQESVELLTCIVCKKAARANSIYCSDDCIRKHAQNALINVSKNAVKSPEALAQPTPVKLGPDEKKKKSKGLFEDLLSLADRKPKVERVYVFERRTGKLLTGNNAPTTANLKKWLQDNPTFEVVQPGSPQALEIEKSKQKGRHGMQSPTNTNTFIPVKSDGAVVTSVVTLSSPTTSSPSQVFSKLFKAQELNKSNSKPAVSPNTHTQPRSATPKQLLKYPQQVSIKPDKPEKDKSASTSSSLSSSNKVLKKQVSSEKETSVQTPSRSESSEPVRVNVRRTLKEQLLIRMNELSDDKKLSIEQVEDFVKATELEMFRLFNKDIGTKYKAKYRSLMFNIKDQKNKTLFHKICAKLIEPRQLVRMSPEEMASQELAQWRENEAKHQLEMIKKSELDMLSCTKNYVLKTHKGEEVIESKATDRVDLEISIPVEDVVSVLNNSTVSSTTEIEGLTPRKDSSYELDSSINPAHEARHASFISSSEKKKASNRERDREREKRHKSKDRHREKTRKRSRSRSREHRHKSSSRKDERREKEERLSKKEEHESSLKTVKVVPPLKITVPPITTVVSKPITPVKTHKEKEIAVKKSTKTPIEKFSLVDQILESTKTVEQAANILNEKESTASLSSAATSIPTNPNVTAMKSKPQSPQAVDSDQEPSSTVSISTPPEDPYDKYSSDFQASLWTGSINMIDVASFQVSIQTVTGNTYLLSKDLPEELDIVGRISPDTVWDYIGKIKRSPNKEVVIIRLVPSAETETIAYTILYKYLDKRKRLGVIKTTSPNIKDFYIMPLGVGQQMPSVLHPNENYEFFEDDMRPDMLLGIVIRIMGKRHSNAAMKIHRKKESTVISNRGITSALDDDGTVTFTPPGSPKSRSETSRIGAGSSRGIRMSHKSNADDEIDAIIKAPIISKNASKAQQPVAAKKDDADEPYSPGGSSDDDAQVIQMTVKDDDLKRKMDEINRQIEAQKIEIAGLLNHDQSSFASGSSGLAPSLANISIPSNLQQILASIQSKPEIPVLQSTLPKVPSMVPPPPLIGSLSHQSGTIDDEYTPEQPVMSQRNIRNSNTHNDSAPSRLAQLSEAELLSMVPDNIDIETSNDASRKRSLTEPPLEKRPRWSEPPPPGLETEYH